MCNCRFWSILSALLAAINIILSIVSFSGFMFYYGNYNAGIWSIMSGVFAACCMHLNILYARRRLRQWYTVKHLQGIQSFSLVLFLLSLVTLGIYLALAISGKQAFVLWHNGYYVTAVFVGLNLYWNFSLFCVSLCYSKATNHNMAPLLSGVRVHPDSDSE